MSAAPHHQSLPAAPALASNPWATAAPAPAAAPPKPAPAPTPVVPAVLAANDKPLLSLDPLPVLKQTAATCLGKLRALAAVVVVSEGEEEGGGGGGSLLSSEDDKCLEDAQVKRRDE